MVERLRLNRQPEPTHKKRGGFVYESRERLDEERRVRLVNALLRDMKTSDGICFLYASLLARTIVESNRWIADQVGKKLDDAKTSDRVSADDEWED